MSEFNFFFKCVFQDFNSTGVHKNIFVSPSSIYETLLLAYFGSGGDTEAELADVLGFTADNSTTTKDEVKKSYLFRRAFQVKKPWINRSLKFEGSNE